MLIGLLGISAVRLVEREKKRRRKQWDNACHCGLSGGLLTYDRTVWIAQPSINANQRLDNLTEVEGTRNWARLVPVSTEERSL